MSTFDEIKVGDKVRANTTYPNGSEMTNTLVVAAKHLGSAADNYGVALCRESYGADRTWEILERAQIPEPQGIGAVVQGGGSTGTLPWDRYIRLNNDEWRWINSFDRVTGESRTWGWLTDLYDDLAVLSEGYTP